MAVPDFQQLMLPLLQLASDGQEHTMASAISELADVFRLSDDDRAELLPGGGQRRFNNRVYWAKTHLRAAGLVASPTRGRFRITPEGEAVLASNPSKIDMKFLSKYPDYVVFKAGAAAGASGIIETGSGPGPQTPDEVIAAAAKQLNDELAQEILDRVVAAPYGFLERLVIKLLRAMDYGGANIEAGIVVGGPGDEGIDGVIRQDKLGLDLIYVQAKRWTHPVKSPDIRNFIGSLQIKSASRGVFITTSVFTADAVEAAGKGGKQIVLIDGATLARYMTDYNVGVRERASYLLKEVDADFFDAG
jgi:restriction system protein